jgi:hypothetical protein
MIEHSRMAKDGIKNSGWDPSIDMFVDVLKKDGQFGTFDKYLDIQKNYPKPMSHYEVFENRYDWLQEK